MMPKKMFILKLLSIIGAMLVVFMSAMSVFATHVPELDAEMIEESTVQSANSSNSYDDTRKESFPIEVQLLIAAILAAGLTMLLRYISLVTGNNALPMLLCGVLIIIVVLAIKIVKEMAI